MLIYLKYFRRSTRCFCLAVLVLANCFPGFAQQKQRVQHKSKKTPNADTLLHNGSRAPDFLLPGLTGKKFKPADFKDTYLYLDFWASWCAPCLAEMGAAENVMSRYPESKVRFVFICFDESESKWRYHIESNRIPGLNLRDPGNNSALVKAYHIKSAELFPG